MNASDVIFTRACWTRNANARDEDGSPCRPNSPKAKMWDAVGALRKAYGDHTKQYWEAHQKLRKHILSKFNHTDLVLWAQDTTLNYEDYHRTLKEIGL